MSVLQTTNRQSLVFDEPWQEVEKVSGFELKDHLPVNAVDVPVTWEDLFKKNVVRYELKVSLCEPEDGIIAVYAAHLPGVASQGKTEEEALANIGEAFLGALESYIANSMPIPWSEEDLEPVSDQEKSRWIVVDAQTAENRRPDGDQGV